MEKIHVIFRVDGTTKIEQFEGERINQQLFSDGRGNINLTQADGTRLTVSYRCVERFHVTRPAADRSPLPSW